MTLSVSSSPSSVSVVQNTPWTADTSETTAVTKFQDRYGHPPDWIIEHLGWLWIGPIGAP